MPWKQLFKKPKLLIDDISMALVSKPQKYYGEQNKHLLFERKKMMENWTIAHEKYFHNHEVLFLW